MKFKLTFKTPDVLDLVKDQVDDYVETLDEYKEDKEELKETLMDSCLEAASGYVRNSEYIVVEFDTIEGKATVVPCV